MVSPYPTMGFLGHAARAMAVLAIASADNLRANAVHADVPDAASFIQAWATQDRTHSGAEAEQESWTSSDDMETKVNYGRMSSKDYIVTFYDDTSCTVESKKRDHQLVRVTQNAGCFDTLKRKHNVDTFRLANSFRLACVGNGTVEQRMYQKAQCRGEPSETIQLKWDFFTGKCREKGQMHPALRSKHYPNCKKESSAGAIALAKVPREEPLEDVPWCYDAIRRRPCDDVDGMGLVKPLIREEKSAMISTTRAAPQAVRHVEQLALAPGAAAGQKNATGSPPRKDAASRAHQGASGNATGGLVVAAELATNASKKSVATTATTTPMQIKALASTTGRNTTYPDASAADELEEGLEERG
mmetsp:Transcript_37207/g.105013  ORF Transcript_37207/g.105013 Transcript_37207/m.105013 type:complete len:358 (+) Transcript_37207:64-1137(+)